MSKKKVLITGITGQDGAYLARFLLEEGYEVHGGFRRAATLNLWRMEELEVANEVKLVPFDLLELTNIIRMVEKVEPDEIYNLAAQSFVPLSFEHPIRTSDLNALGVARILEVIREINPDIRFYQASTSEMFGQARETPQSEETPLYPCSPYGVAKTYAHNLTITYRKAFGIHASSGILFNHESPLRGLEFVTRKITAGLARIRHGQQETLKLGNLDTKRDWGFAGDYVEGVWAMLQQDQGDDYVLATGETHTVREFCEKAAEMSGFDLEWDGEGVNIKGIDRGSSRTIIEVDKALYRPVEVDFLIGNPEKAKQKLGWSPKVNLDQLIEMMVRADLDRAAANILRY